MKQKKIIEEEEFERYLLDINNLNLLEIYYKGMNRIRNLTLRESEDNEINSTRSNCELNKQFRCITYNDFNNLKRSYFEGEYHKTSKNKGIHHNTDKGLRKNNPEL